MTESARVDITQHDVVNIVSHLGLSNTQSMLDAIQLEAERLDCTFVQEGDATFVSFELKAALAKAIHQAGSAEDRDTALDAILESLSAQGIYLKTGPSTDERLRAAAWRWEGKGNRAAGVAAVGATDVNSLPACDMTPRDPAQIVIDVTRDQLVMTADDLIVTSVWRADAYATDVRRFAAKPMSQAPDAPGPRLYMIVAQDADGPADREKVMVDRLTFAGADEVLVRMRMCIRKHLSVEPVPGETAEAQPMPSGHATRVVPRDTNQETVVPQSFQSFVKDLGTLILELALELALLFGLVTVAAVLGIVVARVLVALVLS
ncbi:hypothetical protein [Burkholderia glumae]|uniref:hypothetical protein n=1 Tax=Burkholderia glumae TaxID=337 RepID=UPI002151666D|nr:hypothetical protein [Burkholderia glumae]